jgi:hypothetical protein
VGDLCWDTKGFVLSYRSSEPYLEKRDYKGSLLWAFGAKPAKEDGPAPRNLRPVLMNEAGQVLVADGASLNLSLLDGDTGKKIGETAFALPTGQAMVPLEGSLLERDAIAAWAGKGVVFAALKATEVPPLLRGPLQGRVLARLDLVKKQVEFLPTGLDEAHQLIGVLGSNAVFVSPKGGLMQVQIR